jgi:hypothetical protein
MKVKTLQELKTLGGFGTEIKSVTQRETAVKRITLKLRFFSYIKVGKIKAVVHFAPPLCFFFIDYCK